MESKTCKWCMVNRPLSDFHPSGPGRGPAYICKNCDKERFRNYYRKNRQKVVKKIKEYLLSEQGKIMSKNRNHREYVKFTEKYKTRNLTRNLVKKGLIEKKPCEICKDVKSEAHHTDYSDAINVHWYCRHHHMAVEGRLV